MAQLSPCLFLCLTGFSCTLLFGEIFLTNIFVFVFCPEFDIIVILNHKNENDLEYEGGLNIYYDQKMKTTPEKMTLKNKDNPKNEDAIIKQDNKKIQRQLLN